MAYRDPVINPMGPSVQTFCPKGCEQFRQTECHCDLLDGGAAAQKVQHKDAHLAGDGLSLATGMRLRLLSRR